MKFSMTNAELIRYQEKCITKLLKNSSNLDTVKQVIEELIQFHGQKHKQLIEIAVEKVSKITNTEGSTLEIYINQFFFLFASMFLTHSSMASTLFALASFSLFLSCLCILTSTLADGKVHIIYMGHNRDEDPKLLTSLHYDMLTTVLKSKEAASESMVYSYKHGFSGFAAKLTESQAQMVTELPGVLHVTPSRLHKLETTRSWDTLGLSMDTPNNLLGTSNMGDGVIIGLLDSGIWPELEVFHDEGLGPVPARWNGVCESGDLFSSANCNRKLIGACYFIKGLLADYGSLYNKTKYSEYLSPRDANGHGTHTSTIAAGSFVSNASYKGLGIGTARGGAPKAHLAMYKVCWMVSRVGASCSSADILKAFDEAIHDGVDVLSVSLAYSIPHFSDVDERGGIATGAFHAVAKGITVVCAGGNSGPFPQTVDNTPPWVLTVAASSINRSFPTVITLGNNQTITGQAMYIGKQKGFTGLMYPDEYLSTDSAVSGVCEGLSLKNGTVKGKVVLCFSFLASQDGATYASSVVKAAGGIGVIVAKNPSNSVGPCSNDFPCIQVDYELGTKILYYIESQSSPTVKLSPSKTLLGKPVSTRVAYFSSRGPSSIAPAVLKPDIAAPGVNILAAVGPSRLFPDGGFMFGSGTSMATPHVAGIAALLKSSNPNWSPAAIKSALVTTAWTVGPLEEAIFAESAPRKLADPFDFGGGIVNPNRAADPGLIYDMGTPDYVQYLCSMGYNDSSISRLTHHPTACSSKQPSILDLNLPSITIPSLKNSVTITRTVTNVGGVISVYRAQIDPPLGITLSVEPSVLAFNSSTKQISFTVLVSSNHQVNTGYYFGSLTWSDGVHSVRIPVSVRTEIIESYTDDA